jgi:hypothetical protein
MANLISQRLVETGNDFASIVSEFDDGLAMLERWRLQWVDWRNAQMVELIDVQIQDMNGGMAWRQKRVR